MRTPHLLALIGLTVLLSLPPTRTARGQPELPDTGVPQ